MSRLKRKKCSANNLELSNSENLIDLINDGVRMLYYLTVKEYDKLFEECSDEEIDMLILSEDATFSEIKKVLEMIDKYIK